MEHIFIFRNDYSLWFLACGERDLEAGSNGSAPLNPHIDISFDMIKAISDRERSRIDAHDWSAGIDCWTR
jgi:hypothetical protein